MLQEYFILVSIRMIVYLIGVSVKGIINSQDVSSKVTTASNSNGEQNIGEVGIGPAHFTEQRYFGLVIN